MSVNRRHIGRVCATGVGIALAVGVAGARVPGAWAQQAVAGAGAGASLSVASPGAQLWVKRYNSHGNGGAESVAVSPNGNTVFVTGYTTLSSGTWQSPRPWPSSPISPTTRSPCLPLRTARCARFASRALSYTEFYERSSCRKLLCIM